MNTKILFGSIASVAILILVSFTNVVGSDTINSNEKREQRNNIEISNPNDIESSKIKYFIVELKILTKTIMMKYNNYPDIISLCQNILTKIDILWLQWPAIVCLLIYNIYESLSALSEFIYDLGFLLLSQIVGFFSELIDQLLFVPHCEYFFPYRTQHMFKITSLFNINKLTKISFCSCNENS
jgi:hypothetical protein